MLNNSEFHILVVDDEPFNIEVVAGFLDMESYKLSYATNGKSALKSVFDNTFDLILLDINMPAMDGFEVCQRLKEDPHTKDIPIIFLSALNDIPTITKAFSMGAADYLSKPFNGLELIARVNTQIQLRKYIRELKDKQNRLAKLASTDTTTGLSNRLHFMSVIKKTTGSIQNYPSNLSLAYICIDHMNKINIMYGYKNGDRVIAKTAKVLKENIRPTDTVARLYGSVIVVLMPKTSLEASLYFIKKIQDTINKTKISTLQITLSIGVAEYKENESLELFIARCENLMEESKKIGGNIISSKTSVLNQ
jgi:diguanylate cyclase (GGDEF)-like protein